MDEKGAIGSICLEGSDLSALCVKIPLAVCGDWCREPQELSHLATQAARMPARWQELGRLRADWEAGCWVMGVRRLWAWSLEGTSGEGGTLNPRIQNQDQGSWRLVMQGPFPASRENSGAG